MNRDSEIKLILFDLGGVLIQPSGITTILEWTKKSVEELWLLWLGSESVRAFESGKIDSMEFSKEVVKEFSIGVSPEKFMEEFKVWANTLYPGTLELLSDLRENYTLASLSNTNMVHWDIIKNDLKLDTLFHYNFPSHITGYLKPDSEAYENVAESLNIDFRNILFIDDNLPNIVTADKLGIQACQTRGISEVKTILKEKNLI